jgi:hypothetical protein
MPSAEEPCDFSLFPSKQEMDLSQYISQECTPSGYSITADRCALEYYGFEISDLSQGQLYVINFVACINSVF